MNSTAHFILQGKGGVGKSFVAVMLAQYLARNGELPLCIDTDPVNRTFGRYKGLKVEQLPILGSNGEVDQRQFDVLVTKLVENKGTAVVDNGASSFLPLSRYLLENGILGILAGEKVNVVLHTVVVGGAAMVQTLNGLDTLATNYPLAAKLIVWLNPKEGVVELDGSPFEKTPAYKKHSARVSSIINIPDRTKETFGRDLNEMLGDGLTFDEAVEDGTRALMVRQRLKMYRTELWNALAVASEL